MNIPLQNMPGASRIWIFQCERILTADEQSAIMQKVDSFIEDWSSHGKSLNASMQFLHNQFLVLAVDENQLAASGCSIDKVLRMVESLTYIYGVNFLDRLKVVYYQGQQQITANLSQFWAMRKAGIVSDDTIVFDNTINHLEQLKEAWMIPFSKSWHQQMWT